jgi:four helix bundle protein
MPRFEALEVAMELVTVLREPLAHIGRHDRDLEAQLRRAAASIALNIAEGAQRACKDRLQQYPIAAGSAAEAQTALRIATAWATSMPPKPHTCLLSARSRCCGDFATRASESYASASRPRARATRACARAVPAR